MKVNLIRRRGFSLIELFISMIIIAIFTSFITSNITSQSQTAKSEAEKLAMYITDLTRKADRRHINFRIDYVNHRDYYLYWLNNPDNSVDIEAEVLTPGFEFELKNKNHNIKYDSDANEFTRNHTIIITRTLDDTKYYILLRNGRVRASELDEDIKENEETSE